MKQETTKTDKVLKSIGKVFKFVIAEVIPFGRILIEVVKSFKKD